MNNVEKVKAGYFVKVMYGIALIMVIVSFARPFIYELNTAFQVVTNSKVISAVSEASVIRGAGVLIATILPVTFSFIVIIVLGLRIYGLIRGRVNLLALQDKNAVLLRKVGLLFLFVGVFIVFTYYAGFLFDRRGGAWHQAGIQLFSKNILVIGIVIFELSRLVSFENCFKKDQDQEGT